MTSERWKRMEDLFHAAEAQPPGERESFLARECSDDESLRRDVASLLEQSFPRRDSLRPGRHGPPPVPDLMLDRYLGPVVPRLPLAEPARRRRDGRGLPCARHKLGRDVAVKVLPQEFTSDPDRLARFEREARMLATLNHPNICGIYGLEEADGIRFLVLELVEGADPGGKARRGRRSPSCAGCAGDRAADRRGARGRTRTRRHPPGPEAIERQDYADAA